MEHGERKKEMWQSLGNLQRSLDWLSEKQVVFYNVFIISLELRINFLLEMVMKCFALPHFWKCRRVNIFSTDGPGQSQWGWHRCDSREWETVWAGGLAPRRWWPGLPLNLKMVGIWILCKIVIYCWWEKGSGREEGINIFLSLNFIPGLEQKRKDFRN